MSKKKEITKDYGFPNFTKSCNNIKLCNSQKLIISNIWSFWDYVIKKNNYKKTFMSSLLEQAKFFYIAAESSPLKSQPLLYYYSFLNFAKILINIEKEYGNENLQYHHGVWSTCQGITKFEDSEIEVLKKTEYKKNVSIEFADVLDELTISSKLVLNVKELLIHCVGIHRTYSEIYGSKEVFCKLNNEILYKNGKEMIFESEIQCDKEQMVKLQSLGYNIVKKGRKYYWNESYLTERYKFAREDYYEFSKKLREKGIWYYIGNKGYVNYLSTNEQYRYSPEFIIYNVMFYLGSITRYHPYLFDKIFSDKEQWLMSEFLTTQPKQFIFSATAKILSQPVLKAYADF